MNDFSKQVELADTSSALATCPHCASASGARIGQLNFRGQLKWYESVSCDYCGLRSEADGAGFPPDDLRQRLLDAHGVWCVGLVEIKSTTKTVQTLRAALHYERSAALNLLRSNSRDVYRGTRAECAWLAEQLVAAGESPVYARVPEASPISAS